MSSQLSLLISFAAGIASFLSPCVFPLIPSFFCYLSGASVAALEAGAAINRKRLVIHTLFFVSGFSILFIILGFLFSYLGILLGSFLIVLDVVAGVLIIALGLHLTFNIFRFLQYEKKLLPLFRSQSGFGALLTGFAFGAGWSPCIGPVLTSILLLASRSETAASGVLYLSVYALGLSIPFILLATVVPIRHFKKIFDAYGVRIRKISGIILVGIGMLIAFGRWRLINATIINVGTLLALFAERRMPIATSIAVGIYAIGIIIGGVLLTRRIVILLQSAQVARYRLQTVQTTAPTPPTHADVRQPSRPRRRASFKQIVLTALPVIGIVVCVVLMYSEIQQQIQLLATIAQWLQFQGI